MRSRLARGSVPLLLLPLLCFFLAGCGKSNSDGDRPRLKSAIEKLGKANSPETRFHALGGAAKESFAAGKVEDARKHAQELLELSKDFTRDVEYGNAIHDANLTLGRIAVLEGKIDEGKRCLIESIRTPSARLMDYGPNMSLARDLLEKGEKQSVIEYLTLCKRFWNFGRLDDWIVQVKQGQIPEFGGNLSN